MCKHYIPFHFKHEFPISEPSPCGTPGVQVMCIEGGCLVKSCHDFIMPDACSKLFLLSLFEHNG